MKSKIDRGRRNNGKVKQLLALLSGAVVLFFSVHRLPAPIVEQSPTSGSEVPVDQTERSARSYAGNSGGNNGSESENSNQLHHDRRILLESAAPLALFALGAQL